MGEETAATSSGFWEGRPREMRPLDSLAPAERDAALRALTEHARQGRCEGWEAWEIPEIVHGWARKLGITLDAAAVAGIITAA
jgi:hypothetical protein